MNGFTNKFNQEKFQEKMDNIRKEKEKERSKNI